MKYPKKYTTSKKKWSTAKKKLPLFQNLPPATCYTPTHTQIQIFTFHLICANLHNYHTAKFNNARTAEDIYYIHTQLYFIHK